MSFRWISLARQQVFALICFFCFQVQPASAMTANYFDDTTMYATKIPTTTPPPCSVGEILSYNGANYTCSPNFKAITCAISTQVIQSIDINGNAHCVDNFQSISCAPPKVLQGFDASGNPTCVSATTPPPACGPF